MSIIIFGAGRMGLSHGSMSGLTDASHDIIFIEPNFLVRNLINLFTAKGIEARKDTNGIDPANVTHAVVATPPVFHQQNVDTLKNFGFSGRLMVEKPLQIDVSNTEFCSYVMSGYVLKHSYFWQHLLNDIREKLIKSLTITLVTNQNFVLSDGNWRSTAKKSEINFLYEFGSHCIDLLYCIYPDAKLFIASAKNGEIHIKDRSNDDIAIKLISGSKTVRKSVYNIEVVTSDGRIDTNFYQYSWRDRSGFLLKDYTLASLGVASTSYLRGFEFAEQMAYFLGKRLDAEYSAKSALKVDQVLKQLECEI